MRHPPAQRGFTLIEMMIAMAAGSVIIFTAMAGLRMATRSVAVANRLGLYNEMLGVAMLAGLDEVDAWNDWDDRDDTTPARRPLRRMKPKPASGDATPPLHFGLPFTPFKTIWGKQGYGHGWQEDDRMWAASADNPLTWWPGCAAETITTDNRFGRDAVFGISHPPQAKTVDITSEDRGGGPYGTVPVPIADPKSSSYRYQDPGWIYNQIRGVSDSLGWYGMMDYLPANVLYSYVGAYRKTAPEATDAAGRPLYTLTGWAGPNYNLQYDCYAGVPHAIDWLAYFNGFTVLPSHGRDGTPLSLDELVFYHRSIIYHKTESYPQEMQPRGAGQVSVCDAEVMTRYIGRTADVWPLMTVRPADWPDCAVTVGRYLRNSRFANQVKVTWMDPVTGASAELRFLAMGTTLRGARRNRDGGLDR